MLQGFRVSQTKILRNSQIILYLFNEVHVSVPERGLENMCIEHGDIIFISNVTVLSTEGAYFSSMYTSYFASAGVFAEYSILIGYDTVSPNNQIPTFQGK